jgi:hypothetical protein
MRKPKLWLGRLAILQTSGDDSAKALAARSSPYVKSRQLFFYINSAAIRQLIVSIQRNFIDAVVEVIISCLVLCFLLRYADVAPSRNRATKNEDARRSRMSTEWPEADRRQGALFPGDLLE